MAAIALQHVSKQYPNGHVAVREVSLEIEDGALIVLVGPSGSGKSTVLRLIAGLESPTAGTIWIDGRDVTHTPPQQRDLAMVFQSYALYPHKTVRENLAFGLRVRGESRLRIEERVRSTAAALNVDMLLDRRPAELSGGQRQRVALGRAIIRDPRAFLLDEPLSNLDPVLRANTRAELALLHRRLSSTMVYVTHDQEEAMTLGTCVAVMREGRVEQVGSGLELYHRPANAFVARFVGLPAMNVWRGTKARSGGVSYVVAAGVSVTPPESGVPIQDREEVLIGVRPHDLELTAVGDGDGVGRAEIVEAFGSTTVVHLRVEGLAELVRVVVSGETSMAVGDRGGFRWRRDRLHLFDVDTERRIN